MVCVVYDLTQGDSLDRVRDDLTTLYPFIFPPLLLPQVTNYWLPLIKQCSVGSNKPVILAGNKVGFHMTSYLTHWYLWATPTGICGPPALYYSILCVQADLPYDSEAQSTRLQEVLNTCLEVETGLEVRRYFRFNLYCVITW